MGKNFFDFFIVSHRHRRHLKLYNLTILAQAQTLNYRCVTSLS